METSAIQPATIRQKILDRVRKIPGSSAWEIARGIQERTASVSSLLVTMVKRGEVIREAGHGPRGGYGYFPTDRKVDKSRRPL